MTTLKQFFQKNLYLYFFVLIFSILLPKDTLVAVTIIGFLIAIILLIKNRILISEIHNNRYLYISLAFLIPIGIAMIDTLYPERRMSVFLSTALYLFIGLIPAYLVMHGEQFKKLEILVFYALVFICIDAICQWQFGYHILGYNPLTDARVRGIFGDRYHLSYFLGTYSPIIFFYLLTLLEKKVTFWRVAIALITIILLVIAIFIGGARAGVISFVVSASLFIIYLFYKNKVKHKVRFTIIALISLLIIIVALSQSHVVQTRFIKAIAAFDRDDFWLRLTSLRTNIWYVGFKEIPNYWINGVGTRGFNALYQTYPADYKMFSYIWHPHLHGLEVIIETGVIGFIPYIFVCIYLLIQIFKAKAGNVWFMIAFLSIMPINSHVGIYEGFWMPTIWTSIMIALALAYQGKEKRNFSPQIN